MAFFYWGNMEVIIPEYVVGTRNIRDSRQILMRFPNNYGASIIQGPYTYGGDQGLYEVAVVHFPSCEDEYIIDYDNPVSNGDVLGYLSIPEVHDTLRRIINLPIMVEKPNETKQLGS